jgi:probable rRNA maturation factor
MPVTIVRRAPGSTALDPRTLRRLAQQMLGALLLPRAELSILLTNDAGIHELNRLHRNKDRPTDVLAFPQSEGWPDTSRPVVLLGDVVISLDTAARQAHSRHRPLLAEIRWLLAHGLLHLVGYDHATAEEKRSMVKETRRLVLSAPLTTDHS